MKRRKVVADLIYGTSALCIFGYASFLDGMEPPKGTFEYVLFVAAAIFVIACVLSFFTLGWAAVSALVATLLSSPIIYSGAFYWAHDLPGRINYYPDEVTAPFSSIVAGFYAIRQLWLSSRAGGLIAPRKRWWLLPAAFFYAVTMLAIANWHVI
jgi:hypothetical protein